MRMKCILYGVESEESLWDPDGKSPGACRDRRSYGGTCSPRDLARPKFWQCKKLFGS